MNTKDISPIEHTEEFELHVVHLSMCRGAQVEQVAKDCGISSSELRRLRKLHKHKFKPWSEPRGPSPRKQHAKCLVLNGKRIPRPPGSITRQEAADKIRAIVEQGGCINGTHQYKLTPINPATRKPYVLDK